MLYLEIETRLLEMYKNRSLQPGEPPAGQCHPNCLDLWMLRWSRTIQRYSIKPKANSHIIRRRQLDLRTKLMVLGNLDSRFTLMEVASMVLKITEKQPVQP